MVITNMMIQENEEMLTTRVPKFLGTNKNKLSQPICRKEKIYQMAQIFKTYLIR